MSREPCTLCGRPSIPGLLRGAGKCQYHYNVGQFGKDWADKCAATREPGTVTKNDREEFEAYLEACTDRQVLGVLAKETTAGRQDYARLAKAEAESRGLV